MSFQSTRPRGARRGPCRLAGRRRVFQSTRPRGARLTANAATLQLAQGFNPRARVGRDDPMVFFSLVGDVFQSTRPRGARLVTRGPARPLFCVSIHAPAWGATRRRWLGRPVLRSFQSTRPRGARRSLTALTSRLSDVSIHAPAWGATASS